MTTPTCPGCALARLGHHSGPKVKITGPDYDFTQTGGYATGSIKITPLSNANFTLSGIITLPSGKTITGGNFAIATRNGDQSITAGCDTIPLKQLLKNDTLKLTNSFPFTYSITERKTSFLSYYQNIILTDQDGSNIYSGYVKYIEPVNVNYLNITIGSWIFDKSTKVSNPKITDTINITTQTFIFDISGSYIGGANDGINGGSVNFIILDSNRKSIFNTKSDILCLQNLPLPQSFTLTFKSDFPSDIKSGSLVLTMTDQSSNIILYATAPLTVIKS